MTLLEQIRRHERLRPALAKMRAELEANLAQRRRAREASLSPEGVTVPPPAGEPPLYLTVPSLRLCV